MYILLVLYDTIVYHVVCIIFMGYIFFFSYYTLDLCRDSQFCFQASSTALVIIIECCMLNRWSKNRSSYIEVCNGIQRFTDLTKLLCIHFEHWIKCIVMCVNHWTTACLHQQPKVYIIYNKDLD